jgi:hypothetical protein
MAIGPRSGRVFASGGDDGVLNLYSITNESPIYRFGPFSAPVTCCSFDYSEEFIAFGTEKGYLSILDLDPGKTLVAWTVPGARFTCCDFHPHIQDVIAAGDSTGRVYLFGSQQRRPLQQYAAHRGSVTSVRICPQGTLLVSAGSDRFMRVFDLSKGEFEGTIQSNCLQFLSIAFHPTEQVVAGCSESRTIHFFDLDRRCEVKGGLIIGQAAPQSLRFSSDGSVVSSCSTSTVSLFRSYSPDFADHLQVSLTTVYDMQLFSTSVAIASAEGPACSIILVKTDEFRLLPKKKTAAAANCQAKVIDGSNLPNVPDKRVRKAPSRVLADLQPKPQAASANDVLYRAFKTDRTQYVGLLAQRHGRLVHLRDLIKKQGFAFAATEVAANGESVAELMTVVQMKPDTVRMENAAVCIDALQFGFTADPGTAVVVLGIVLTNIAQTLSVVTGGEEAAQIMETIHGIAPVVGKAADAGVPGAKQLLDAWPRLLR